MANDGVQATFADMLLGLAQGRFHEELTDEMRKLVKAMNRTLEVSGGKPKGKLVLTIDLMLDRGIYDLAANIRVTTPAPTRQRTVMYSTPDGALSKNDVRQMGLALTSPGRREVGFGETVDFRERQAGQRREEPEDERPAAAAVADL